MIIDGIDISNLPDNAEEAFLIFEQRLRAALEDAKSDDRRENSDMNGNYIGSYVPERYYVSSVLAFLDEYDMDIDVADITEVKDRDFHSQFSQFFTKVNYAKTRFALRRRRLEMDGSVTPVRIGISFKEQIHKHLDKIRKIVNQEISDQTKKDAIFRKIASLQSEVDRDRTSIDALFGRLIDLSKTLGECAQHIEPLVEIFERVKKLLVDGTEKLPSLPKSQRPKMITQESEKSTQFNEPDDEMPF